MGVKEVTIDGWLSAKGYMTYFTLQLPGGNKGGTLSSHTANQTFQSLPQAKFHFGKCNFPGSFHPSPAQ